MASSRCTITKLSKKKLIIVQNQFKTEIGLIVVQPKLGSGTLNYGNIAQCFFYNHNLSSNITGVDEQLIYGFFFKFDHVDIR